MGASWTSDFAPRAVQNHLVVTACAAHSSIFWLVIVLGTWDVHTHHRCLFELLHTEAQIGLDLPLALLGRRLTFLFLVSRHALLIIVLLILLLDLVHNLQSKLVHVTLLSRNGQVVIRAGAAEPELGLEVLVLLLHRLQLLWVELVFFILVVYANAGFFSTVPQIALTIDDHRVLGTCRYEDGQGLRLIDELDFLGSSQVVRVSHLVVAELARG